MNFDQYMPAKMITGRGCVRQNAGEFTRLGGACLVVTSGSAAKKSGALDDVLSVLKETGTTCQVYDRVEPNPTLTGAKAAGDLARSMGAQYIVGIGGGSALDAAKAAAVFAANDMDAMEIYKLNWPNRALPLILIGTTAGTGSEVAPYAVMTTPEGRKVSFTSAQCYATVAFGDAGYTDTLPLRFTISTALDALSHALEGYFAVTANALSDLYAIQAVRILYPQLQALAAVREAGAITPETRDQLYFASILAGFTLNRCGTCYCHCLGYYLSEQHDLPHGNACAVFLPDFIRRCSDSLPEKASALFAGAGCTGPELCALIEQLNEYPKLSLSSQEIEDILKVPSYVKSFSRSAPDGISMEDARALLSEIFA